jgi:hypothetical protein
MGLDQGFWHDEVYSVSTYIQGGPRTIFFGDYVPNNHMMFSLLSWLTISLGGESELAIRFWSYVPAAATVIGLSVWLFRRWGLITSISFLVLWTTSPVVTNLSREARGYGLAFAAMTLLLVGAADAVRGHSALRSRAAVAGGALLGTLTLPVFVLPSIAVFAALLVPTDTRRWAKWLPVAVGIPCFLWYLPVLRDLIGNSRQKFGEPLSWHSVVTEPIKLLALPEVGAAPSALRLIGAGALAALVAIGLARLWRRSRVEAAVFILPVAFTLVVLTLLQLFVVQRFISYLVIPVLVGLSIGCALVIEWLMLKSRAAAPAVGATFLLAALLLASSVLPTYGRAIAIPKEAFKEVGSALRGAQGRVLSNTLRPTGLAYYVDARVEVVPNEELTALSCTLPPPFTVIEHPFLNEPLDLRCLQRRGGERTRFLQSERGDYIDVWRVGDAAP